MYTPIWPVHTTTFVGNHPKESTFRDECYPVLLRYHLVNRDPESVSPHDYHILHPPRFAWLAGFRGSTIFRMRVDLCKAIPHAMAMALQILSARKTEYATKQHHEPTPLVATRHVGLL